MDWTSREIGAGAINDTTVKYLLNGRLLNSVIATRRNMNSIIRSLIKQHH